MTWEHGLANPHILKLFIMHFYHHNMLVGVCRCTEKKNWSDFSFFVGNMRLIRPLAEAKKHLKSWFLATFGILLMC